MTENTSNPAKPSLWASLRELPRPFWVLCVGTFINRFGTFVFPFLTLYLTSLGHSPGAVKYALAAHGLGHLGATIMGGWLADRIGRRNTIAFSMFAAAATMLCLSAAEGLPMITVFAALTGFSIACYHPASSALLADIIPSGKRVRAYTLLRIATNGGWAAGVATGGWLAERSYTLLFWGDAVTCAIFGTLALLFLPHGLRRTKLHAPWGEALASVRANRPFLALFAANFCAALVFCQMTTTFALQVSDAGFPKHFYGSLLALNGVLIVLLELPISNRTTVLPVLPVLAVGYLLIGGGFALNLFGSSIAVLVIAMVVFTFGEMLSLPVSGAYLAELAPADMRGRYMGVFGLSWALATTVGPLGMDLYAWNPTSLWVASGLLGAIGAAVILAAGRIEQPAADTDGAAAADAAV